MLQRILLIALACAVSMVSISQSQSDIQLPKIIPPSADAASLGKYGQIPVDKSVGIPQISIPLYEIKTPRFSIPVSLSYHASGIKVEEIASWVGAGWSLNSGGAITRTIIGFTDDGNYGFLTNHSQIKKAANIQWPADITYISNVVEKKLDTEPDNFFFNFSGHSGAFVFGEDAKPVVTPYQPIKINFNSSAKIFDITDENGNSYYFEAKEYVNSFISVEMSGISTWYLTKMISADRSDTVNFSYTTDASAQTEFSYSFSQDLTDLCNSGTTTLRGMVTTVNQRQYNPVRVKTISFNGGKVDFIAKGGRLDEGNMLLDSVIVYNQNAVTKQYNRLKGFKLLSDYFYSTWGIPSGFPITVSEADKHRLKLIGIQEIDAANNSVKDYQFEYNSTMLPQVHSFAQDKWGYFNGNWANKSLLESEQFTYEPWGGAPQQIAVIGGNDGADRSVSETYMKAGVLQKIIYPTKGYTVFDYESNKLEMPLYTNGSFNVTAIGALNQGGTQELNTQTYTPTGDMLNSGGNIFTVKVTSGNNPGGTPFPYVKVVRVSDGAIIYNSGNTNTSIYNLVLPLEANVQYSITSEAHGTSYPPTSSSPLALISTTYKTPNGTGITSVGGLRIASIKNYNSDGTLATTETYKYGNIGESGAGVELAIVTTNRYGHGAVCTNNGYSGDPSAYILTFSNNSFYPLSTLSGSPVAYPTVTVYQGDALQNIGKTVYKYTIYRDSMVISMSNGKLKPIPVTWKNGDPDWIGQYRNNGNNQYTLIEETFNDFELIYKKPAIGTIMGYRPEPIGDRNLCSYFVYPTVCTSNGLVYTCNVCMQGLDWKPQWLYWYDYPISTGARILKQRVARHYSSDGSLALTETASYTYDNPDHLQPTAIATTNSKGETFTKQLKYPSDYPSVEPYATMVVRNIITPVVEQLVFKGTNSSPLQATKTNYNFWSGTSWSSSPTNIIVPQTVETKTLPQTSYETRLRYTSYDDRGNITTVSKENDVKKTYLWGYNKLYPVAEITGVDYATASTYISQSILNTPLDDASFRTQLNALRSIPNVQVTTYTYKPLVGMTSATDINGRTSYYIYDAFGRLDHIKDKDGNIIKKFCYNYLGQSTPCTIFGNAVQSGSFTKNDCGSGYSGSSVTYTVPANTYYASTQADANTIALNDLNTNGQAYANANGTCSVPPVTVTGQSYINYPYTVKFTNVSTGLIYYMYINPFSGSSAQMPSGTYNINFYPSTGSYTNTTFYVNYYSSYGSGANFYNINIASGSWVRIGN